MTDELEQNMSKVRKPTPRRQGAYGAATQRTPRVPHPRREPEVIAGGANGTPDIEDVLARLERLEASGTQFVQSEPDHPVSNRVADDEELTDFQREVRANTHPMPQDFTREGRYYNFPLKFFAKPDGQIVQLQGDPGNTEYYRKKGFVDLSPEQVERYLKVERLQILKLQQRKAALINNMRRVIALDPTLRAGLGPDFDTDVDKMTIPELEAVWNELTHNEDGTPRYTFQRPQRLQDADDRRALRESERMLAGVETTPPSRRVVEFENEQEQAAQPRRRGRDIEVTPQNARQFS